MSGKKKVGWNESWIWSMNIDISFRISNFLFTLFMIFMIHRIFRIFVDFWIFPIFWIFFKNTSIVSKCRIWCLSKQNVLNIFPENSIFSFLRILKSDFLILKNFPIFVFVFFRFLPWIHIKRNLRLRNSRNLSSVTRLKRATRKIKK